MTELVATEQTKKTRKPKAQTSLAHQELERLQKQFDEFDSRIKELTLDRMNQAPKQEVEPQTQLSQREIAKKDDIYLKPIRSIGSPDRFNERFRDEWTQAKQYVQFIAENTEIIGESIDLWTKPYGGVPAEEWIVPVNKPVWGPRYLAEQISRCQYHRMTMTKSETSRGAEGTYYGDMVVDNTINRIDARPVLTTTSTFMGSKAF